MPALQDIEWDRAECVAAVRDFYHFLVKMYLRESDVIEPPAGGWPHINPVNLRSIRKAKRVIGLLRHLPYLRHAADSMNEVQGASDTFFADWKTAMENTNTAYKFRRNTEGGLDVRSPYLVGLTSGREESSIFMLDTRLAVVYWVECDGAIRDEPTYETIEDDAYGYAHPDEAGWRADSGAWTVTDFFETLKDQFRELKFVPVSRHRVYDVYTHGMPEGMLEMVQSIYREHGWPDLEQYRKTECLQAIRKALHENYPGERSFELEE